MEFDPADADLSLASLFAGWAMADELQRRLAADGFEDSRFADGVLFQHLVAGPVTISTLAERLGVTGVLGGRLLRGLRGRRAGVRGVGALLLTAAAAGQSEAEDEQGSRQTHGFPLEIDIRSHNRRGAVARRPGNAAPPAPSAPTDDAPRSAA